ncbi:MAG: metal-sensing transcriptional repressor [Mesotoga sp.]|jgi:DNA-binding FrmR family transcriptional regulator|uniref:metal-sensing transcriptional repressor n=1 Tax=unclassified Mesotoga TaxID=1184398 RepID=UPI000EF19EA9|nr:metal-sensing transcriptional repressor [Mesotoga sp.]MDI9367070.1 metal-sensing transcriptional repressor [Thermotogota bacterium]RLL84264.1 CsoR family transcriptional regulator [Mesotoga sp. BH458_6_3_2_1]MDD2333379.1 metal-sensing transcriptional repressor [Mesotoga sp.]MDD3681538.1 metal-sensing transcriptional repressor [Mesotoga sp.]MDD4208331.1 metal-sensing transcriptional repressor [Mesotoga sp.]
MDNHSHHKHSGALKILRTARGQIDGIVKMIEEERYCIDISTQLLAVISLLKKANTTVVNKHIETCIREAIDSGNADEKIEELETLMKYIEKSL